MIQGEQIPLGVAAGRSKEISSVAPLIFEVALFPPAYFIIRFFIDRTIFEKILYVQSHKRTLNLGRRYERDLPGYPRTILDLSFQNQARKSNNNSVKNDFTVAMNR